MQTTEVDLKYNILSKAQYTGTLPNDKEFYLVYDDLGLTSSDVTTALGYTPYNSTNPSGYQANVIETVKVNGTAQTVTSKAVDISVPTQASDIGAEAALGYTPANVSLSNLDATGQKVIDGQWVNSSSQLANGVSAPTSEATAFNLATYLPDDNYSYEVLCTVEVTTGSSSGSFTKIALLTDIISYNIYVCQAQTRSNSSVGGFGSCILPVGTGRKLRVGYYISNTGTYSLWLRGYRRIGTNS